MVKAILLKPLDGDPEGAEREFDPPDFDTLERMGAVRRAPYDGTPRIDGPTVAEYVAAGYRAEHYPPQGYASRSTPEEIADAVSAQSSLDAPDGADKCGAAAGGKAAPAPQNKAAPAVANKDLGRTGKAAG